MKKSNNNFGGYIILHRKWLNNEICQDAIGEKIWLRLLFDAHFGLKPKQINIKDNVYMLKRGELYIKPNQWIKKYSIHFYTFKKWIGILEEKGQITVKKEYGHMLISIINYDMYQSLN